MNMAAPADPALPSDAPLAETLHALWSDLQAQAGGLAALPALLDLSAEQREAVYLTAYRHYRAGDFREARKWFALLATAAPGEPRAHMGLGACLQMEQAHERAVRHYVLASVLDLTDPLPAIHGAECLMAMGRSADALKALAHARQQAVAQPAHHGLLERIHCLQSALAGQGGG